MAIPIISRFYPGGIATMAANDSWCVVVMATDWFKAPLTANIAKVLQDHQIETLYVCGGPPNLRSLFPPELKVREYNYRLRFGCRDCGQMNCLETIAYLMYRQRALRLKCNLPHVSQIHLPQPLINDLSLHVEAIEKIFPDVAAVHGYLKEFLDSKIENTISNYNLKEVDFSKLEFMYAEFTNTYEAAWMLVLIHLCYHKDLEKDPSARKGIDQLSYHVIVRTVKNLMSQKLIAPRDENQMKELEELFARLEGLKNQSE